MRRWKSGATLKIPLSPPERVFAEQAAAVGGKQVIVSMMFERKKSSTDASIVHLHNVTPISKGAEWRQSSQFF